MASSSLPPMPANKSRSHVASILSSRTLVMRCQSLPSLKILGTIRGSLQNCRIKNKLTRLVALAETCAAFELARPRCSSTVRQPDRSAGVTAQS